MFLGQDAYSFQSMRSSFSPVACDDRITGLSSGHAPLTSYIYDVLRSPVWSATQDTHSNNKFAQCIWFYMEENGYGWADWGVMGPDPEWFTLGTHTREQWGPSHCKVAGTPSLQLYAHNVAESTLRNQTVKTVVPHRRTTADVFLAMEAAAESEFTAERLGDFFTDLHFDATKPLLKPAWRVGLAAGLREFLRTTCTLVSIRGGPKHVASYVSWTTI
jgi:hypothetical protein